MILRGSDPNSTAFYVMGKQERFISLNGEIRPAGDAAVSPEMNGLYHGTGAFETFLSDKGRIFRYAEHMDRLNRGLKYLGFNRTVFIQPEKIRIFINQLLDANGLQMKKVRVRVQISDSGTGGYNSEPPDEPLQVITADGQLPSGNNNALILKSSGVCVVPSACKPANLKLSNMLHYRDAMRQARKHGADDALMCTTDGFVAESSVANVFWYKDGQVFTPSADCDILPGIMRNALVELIDEGSVEEIKLNQGRFKPDEIHSAECIWLTNSVMGMVPVSALDHRKFKSDHYVFRLLQERLKNHISETSG